MKIKIGTLLLLLFAQSILLAQKLDLEPYVFVSRAQDTVLAELGNFKVLEDRANPSKDSIRLAFIRFKSTNPKPGSPIVYLAGGPGGSGSGTAEGGRFKLFMKLREIADVIAFDQRGTGMSDQLPDCPYRAVFELKRPIEKAEYLQKSRENITKCLNFWEEENVNLNAYNTTESARDIDELRKVLGAEKISIWGISYGSHLAFEYLRLFEDNINKMVLASLEGPNQTIKLPKHTEAFVFKIAELAKDNYGADKKYPDLKEKILAVHKRLKNKAVTASYKNRSGGMDTIGISNFELQAAIATFYLKNPDDSRKLPKTYSQLYQGDFSGIAADVMVVKRYIFNGIRPMPFAMDMQSGISDLRAEAVGEQIDNTILGSTINFLLYEWMKSNSFPQLPDSFRVLKTNTVDALLLSGTLDGRTYLESGFEIAKKFKKGQHLIIENAGHDLYMASPLIGDILLDFFKGKNLKVNRLVLKPTLFD
ncbi:alpha/beta fold hydrolase [Robiginitalea sp. IMCC43444]|uniref:alpha/beta fold hydrolase n=1 Tax=Robiginitalea sp. IMCC43444 TaxID=3459121 RepID=UPI0040417F8A